MPNWSEKRFVSSFKPCPDQGKQAEFVVFSTTSVDLWGRLSNPPEVVESLTGQRSQASRRSRKAAGDTSNRASVCFAQAPPEEKGRLSNPDAAVGSSGAGAPGAREEPRPLEPVRRFVQRRLDESEIDRLVTAYRTGRSLVDLAAEFRIHRRTVAGHLEARGVPRRINKPKMTQADIHDAAGRHHAGESIEAIARSLGVDPATVRRTLKRQAAGLGREI